MPEEYDAIIVGGGHNGLVAASYLQKAGIRTVILERREFVGGACVTEEIFPGFKFSSCAVICHLLQDKIIKDLELRRHGFDVYQLEPRYFGPFPNGDHLFIYEDAGRTAKEIGRFSAHDEQAYPQWLEFWEKVTDIIYPFFLRSPPSFHELTAHAVKIGAEDVLQKTLTSTMRDILDEYFENDSVKGFFSYWGQDVGDPDSPGGPFCLTYLECNRFTSPENFGIVKGGMGGITQSLQRAAESLGAKVLTGAEVEKILIVDGQAIGVKLRDGREFHSSVVISNADPKRTFLKLVGEEELEPEFVKRVKKLKTEVTCIKILCSLKGLPDFSSYLGTNFNTKLVAHGLMCPSIDYLKKAWEDAKAGVPARDPVIWFQIPSVYDPTMAPEGCHSIALYFQYAPVKPKAGEWIDIKQKEGARLIGYFTKCYAPNFREILLDWEIFTPVELESRMGLTDGNIRHLDMIPSQMLSARPMFGWANYETPVKGLYLCGGGTHPGGEVTGAPGHNAAKVVIEHFTRHQNSTAS